MMDSSQNLNLLISPLMHGLRYMEEREAALFADWEHTERPYPWSEDAFLKTHGSLAGMVLVLEEFETPVAFIVLQVVGDEASIQNVMTRVDKRRRGFGRQIIEKSIAFLRECGVTSLYLDVDPLNESAKRLYDMLHFVVVQYKSKAYPNGENALLMRLTL